MKQRLSLHYYLLIIALFSIRRSVNQLVPHPVFRKSLMRKLACKMDKKLAVLVEIRGSPRTCLLSLPYLNPNPVQIQAHIHKTLWTIACKQLIPAKHLHFPYGETEAQRTTGTVSFVPGAEVCVHTHELTFWKSHCKWVTAEIGGQACWLPLRAPPLEWWEIPASRGEPALGPATLPGALGMCWPEAITEDWFL